MFRNQAPDTDDDLLFGGAFTGMVLLFSIAGALLTNSTGNLLFDAVVAFAILVGAFLSVAVVVLIGALVYRFILGCDGIDSPSNVRIGFCIAGLALLITVIINGL